MKLNQKLTSEDVAEKTRLGDLVEQYKPAWEKKNKTKLTRELSAQLLGEMRGKALSQSGVSNFMSTNRPTRLSVDFVHAFAALLGFDPSLVGERFELKPYVVDLALQSLARQDASTLRLVELTMNASLEDRRILSEVAEKMLKYQVSTPSSK